MDEFERNYIKRRRMRRRRRNLIIKLSWTVCAMLFVLAASAYLLWNSQPYQPDDTQNLLTQNSSSTTVVAKETYSQNADTGNNETDADNNETEWNLILVNKWNPIPDEYEVEVTQLSNGESVDTRIYSALQDMFDAAKADGVYAIVASGYRTTEEQQRIMDEKIAALRADGFSTLNAEKEAETWVAIPGTSEHQLGISVDINADGINSAGYEVYEWLDENGYRFGFIRRYPPDKTDITGVSNEPWHYRYVGTTAAAEMYRQNLCLEEYLDTEK